eukprot:TRINITY_DN3614_c0_g1_i1.p5 TRINITY_DN3614_c0_g1~~TRINITY_DN3614_c0_g1_i1.p5  ORF type:complete len:117 (-),score=25.95 TRINITY_DN3614_c0_g1_i1:872-1222(-)
MCATHAFEPLRWFTPNLSWEPDTGLWAEASVIVSYLADVLRNTYSSVWPHEYCEYYRNVAAAWVLTFLTENVVVQLNVTVLRHLDALDKAKMADGPDGEAAFAMYCKMRRAVNAFS